MTPAGSVTTAQYAKIDLVGFDTLNAGTLYKFLIGKVYNPAVGVGQFNLLVLAYNINTATGVYNYVNSLYYTMFLSNTVTTIAETNNVTFGPAIVQDTNQEITHTIKSSLAISIGDYYITDMQTATLLNDLIITGTANLGPTQTCDSSKFEYCIIMEDIQWIIWKFNAAVSANTAVTSPLPIKTIPWGIERTVTTWPAYLFQSNVHTSTVTETVSIAAWSAIKQTITALSMSLVFDIDYYMSFKNDVEVLVYFTTSMITPASGSFLITFTAGYVPYAHCRSMLQLGSLLVGVAGSGELGCNVQSNSWYITGF